MQNHICVWGLKEENEKTVFGMFMHRNIKERHFNKGVDLTITILELARVRLGARHSFVVIHSSKF